MNNLPAQLKQQGAAPVLKILNGAHKGKQFRLLGFQITIGRHGDCDVIFKDNPQCSRHHARIKRKGDSYSVESLNPKNPVLVNQKAVSLQVLKPEDKITIGNMEMMFLKNSPVVLPLKQFQAAAQPQKIKRGARQTSWLTPPRLMLIIILIGGGFLFLSDKKKSEKAKQIFDLRTKSDVLEEVKMLEELNQKESKKKDLSSLEKAARVAFIQGFRDYRKGYFHRALQNIQHCLTLHKMSSLCQSYSNKSKIHIDKMIQKKIRLGNAYKKNKQYGACMAAFKSVEIMIQDSKSVVYKEAKTNRELCEIQLKNKI